MVDQSNKKRYTHVWLSIAWVLRLLLVLLRRVRDGLLMVLRDVRLMLVVVRLLPCVLLLRMVLSRMRLLLLLNLLLLRCT